MSIERNHLLSVFDGLLQPERFKDYGPNGLQVEGKREIRRIVSGVTASRALIEAAIDAQADAIVAATEATRSEPAEPRGVLSAVALRTVMGRLGRGVSDPGELVRGLSTPDATRALEAMRGTSGDQTKDALRAAAKEDK